MEERNKGTLGDDFAIQSLKDPQGSLRNFQILTFFFHCRSFRLLRSSVSMFFPSLSRLSRCSEPSRNPLLLDVAATENGRAHVITDGLVGAEQQMMPLLGFLAKSRREAEFPTEILMRFGH